MQLSTRGRYAVMAMTELAGREGARATPLATIAERQQISRPYLEQLFARLRRRGRLQAGRRPLPDARPVGRDRPPHPRLSGRRLPGRRPGRTAAIRRGEGGMT